MFLVCFFFFKQKTAYEMRISDWSSDVCSSDLVRPRSTQAGEEPQKSPCIGRGFFVKNADQARALILAARRDLWRAALFLWIWQIGRASCRERVCQYV